VGEPVSWFPVRVPADPLVDNCKICPQARYPWFKAVLSLKANLFFGLKVRNWAAFVHSLWITPALFFFLFQIFSIRFMGGQVLDSKGEKWVEGEELGG
jgi:hypothetical protein